MYPNLDAEMARKGLKRKDLAPLFNDRVPTVSDKLNGKYPILLDEAVRIQQAHFRNLSLEYLFKKTSERGIMHEHSSNRSQHIG